MNDRLQLEGRIRSVILSAPKTPRDQSRRGMENQLWNEHTAIDKDVYSEAKVGDGTGGAIGVQQYVEVIETQPSL